MSNLSEFLQQCAVEMKQHNEAMNALAIEFLNGDEFEEKDRNETLGLMENGYTPFCVLFSHYCATSNPRAAVYLRKAYALTHCWTFDCFYKAALEHEKQLLVLGKYPKDRRIGFGIMGLADGGPLVCEFPTVELCNAISIVCDGYGAKKVYDAGCGTGILTLAMRSILPEIEVVPFDKEAKLNPLVDDIRVMSFDDVTENLPIVISWLAPDSNTEFLKMVHRLCPPFIVHVGELCRCALQATLDALEKDYETMDVAPKQVCMFDVFTDGLDPLKKSIEDSRSFVTVFMRKNVKCNFRNFPMREGFCTCCVYRRQMHYHEFDKLIWAESKTH